MVATVPHAFAPPVAVYAFRSTHKFRPFQAHLRRYGISMARLDFRQRRPKKILAERGLPHRRKAFHVTVDRSAASASPGPDVGILYEGQRIWFEATCPTQGQRGSPDEVPDLIYGSEIATEVPNEKIVLRYLNSISTKYKCQYANWLKKGIVSSKDALIIALNPRKISHDRFDTNPPRVLQAAFTIGSPFLTVDRHTRGVVDRGYSFRNLIRKASEEGVSTGLFLEEEYGGLSGLLCSRVDAVNRPNRLGGEFQLVPNPNSKLPLPEQFKLRGTYFRSRTDDKGNIIVTPEQHD